ncbi:MAG: YjfB family protein [Thiotrichales bacterium]|nr:YjfB family protein [Thiotrichales bacterium]
MELSNLSANAMVGMALAQQQAAVQEQVGVAMLKKSIDTQSQNAMALISSVQPATSSTHLPSHLGQNINTKA